MTIQQRRNFLIGGLVGTLLVAFLVYRMFLVPLADLRREFDKAYDEAEAKQKEWNAFEAEKKKLAHVRLLGLPLSEQEGVSEYTQYLRTIFEDAGVEGTDVEIKVTEARNQGVRKGQPGHFVRTFQVNKARLTWPQLLVFLDRFQQTPLLHRIKTFTIEKPDDGGKLPVTMVIETLSVARSDPKPPPGKFDPKGRPENLWGVNLQVLAFDAVADYYHAPIGWAMILRGQSLLLPKTPEGRNYADLKLRNPFVGALPPVVAKVEKPKEAVKDPPPTKPSINVLQSLKFEGFSGVQQDDKDKREVFLHNLLQPLSSDNAYVTLTSNKSFVILDLDGKKPVLKGKVLRIEPRVVYFQVGESVYALDIEQTVWDAMWEEGKPRGMTKAKPISRALPRSRLEELGLQKLLEPAEK